ncbi:immunoglobulin-like domain-containing protein [Agromyces silvae]|uniref:immunoglobulin-like domain-containing protein n=1 Tax=Agromyces silvae TaxID=3388266 RepID=UPI00280BD38B|nr:immunoglobulin-like domain-containing protein [Agromyces protaetiae]
MHSHAHFRRRTGAAALTAALVAGLIALPAVPAHAAGDTNATAAVENRTLIDTTSTDWRYHDAPADPAGDGPIYSWAAAGYDDTSWKTAKGSFGALRGAHVPVGGNAVNTPLTQYKPGTSTNVETFFFRTDVAITADEVEAAEGLEATVRFDDALAVFVNGERVAGFVDERFDESKGNMQYVGNGGGSPIVRSFTIDPELLIEGNNTIAVALYQDRDTSSDIYFDFEQLELVAGGGTEEPEPQDPTRVISTETTDWRYQDTGVDPAGTGELFSWTGADYDDSSWKTAKASFGALRGAQVPVSGNAVNTLLTQYKPGGTTNIETFFFRTDVALTEQQVEGGIRLRGTVRYDDALGVWVNGEKVAGFLDDGFDPAQGNLQYLGASNGAPVVSSFTIPNEALQAGENTVAVALYQDRASSSDIFFDFEQLDVIPPLDPNAPITVSDVILNVGATEADRNVAWYASLPGAARVEVAPAAAMTGDTFPTEGVTAFESTSGEAADGQFWHHATIAGVAEHSAYVYRVGNERGWSPVYGFETASFDGDFDFLYVGDAQIGASGNTPRDAEGWLNTTRVANEMFPASEFLLSGGDQVEHAGNEEQYDGFLAPELVREIPIATVNGNHDVGSTAYNTHFNMPNLDMTYGAPGSASQSGGNHWFIYKDVLVITLNSNNRDNARHAEYVEKVVAEQGDNAKWRVVTFHHSIYSVANHSLSADIVERREQLSPVFTANDIDLVLMGHDHVYTRSYLMDGRTPVQEVDTNAELRPEEGQVLYLTGNSSSGSKYYTIRDTVEFGYDAVALQERVPSFMNIEVTDGTLTATTYRTTDRGVVDRVVLHQVVEPDVTAPVLTVPETTELTVGDAFDPMAGVSAIDAVDGDLTAAVTVTGTVDTSVAGVSTLTYSVTDASGNTATATRVVTVVEATVEPEPEPEPNPEPEPEPEPEPNPGTIVPLPGADLPSDLRTLELLGLDRAAGTISVRVADRFIGEELTFFVSSEPQRLATITPTAGGAVSLALPRDLAAGTHRLAAYAADGSVTQWLEFTWPAASTPAGSGGSGGQLADTGFEGTLPLLGGLLVLLVGAGLVLRRRTARA